MRGKQVALLLVLIQCCLVVQAIKISSFNVRVFGTTKLQKEVSMSVITQIVHQYDIMVIQEVRGFREPARLPIGILEWVNQDGNDYAICNSAFNYKPSGSSHRELQLFLYRPAVVTCVETDEAENIDPEYASRFRRPPTIGQFRVTSGTTTTEFFIVGIHTQPSRAVSEINALVDVYNTFRQLYGTDIAFIMGDFNYGGSYVSSKLRDNLDIDQPPFVRLINDTDGTTVKPFEPTPQKSSKPYDRIYAVPGGSIITAVGVDRYRYTLTPEQYYRSVSDHYPVYVEVNFGNNGVTSSSTAMHMKEENNSLRQGVDFDPRVDYNEQQNGLCPPGKNNYYYLICALNNKN